MNNKKDFNKIVTFLKNNGFFFPTDEIYGGTQSLYDLADRGVIFKNLLIKKTTDFFLDLSDDLKFYQLDSSIIHKEDVFLASGHLKNFFDVYSECKDCNFRNRIDDLKDYFLQNNLDNETVFDTLLKQKKIHCLNCNSTNLSKFKKFNLMFELNYSLTDEKTKKVFLRPETCQGIFINFQNILKIFRPKIPFAILQTGKAFRNEVTAKNLFFKTKEFTQLEVELFCKKEDEENWFNFFTEKIFLYLINDLKISQENLKKYQYNQKELAHYSKKTTDIMFNFPFGWKELLGICNRGTFDLENHIRNSNSNLKIFDEETKHSFIPSVIEPSIGIERLMLALLIDYYEEDEKRVFLKIPFDLSIYQIAVFPLAKKLKDDAKKVYLSLKKIKKYRVIFQDNASIGKLYHKYDAIGTFFAITFDFDSLNDNCVSLRFRDSKEQKRISIQNIDLEIDKIINEM
ncbi:glycine--tRNA ligase [symbiont of Argiope bruennichi]|uniref:glycine--tRNA ligase n=1 Tax=symbiont of Argiope bruennichi TaxID=2810479 RepID=UPI003DA4074E